MEYSINTSEIKKFAKTLKAGDRVLLSGVVFTARDAAHKLSVVGGIALGKTRIANLLADLREPFAEDHGERTSVRGGFCCEIFYKLAVRCKTSSTSAGELALG